MNTAWYFYLTPGHPRDPQKYVELSVLDFPHPQVNLNFLQDATSLWSVADPVSYALDAIKRYLLPIKQIVGERVQLPDFDSPRLVIETCILFDCENEKALLVRMFDLESTPRQTLPQNYEWKPARQQ